MTPRSLIVNSREIHDANDLLRYADAHAPLAWLRRGYGIVGVGEAARITVPAGSGRAAVAAREWETLCAGASVDDTVQESGSGLVAFGAFPFDDASASAGVLIVPRVIIGRTPERAWVTHIRASDEPEAGMPQPVAFGPHWAGSVGPGSQTAESYQASVRRALEHIAAGELSKVVVARDLVGTVPADADVRRLLRSLCSDYPDTWAFAVDGMMGASPETLVTVSDGTVTARVLAGTVGRGADTDADSAAAADLATSTKNLEEHRFAVRSVLDALRPHTRALAASDQPFVLTLPNLFHLATDVEGSLSDAASALDLLGALHPTAAVAGTPTDAALAAIRTLEPFDRGRYGGPVGWIDAAGNGEWAIALRCAQFTAQPGGADTLVTAYAGAGIVAGSDPETELLETRIKFRPIVSALA